MPLLYAYTTTSIPSVPFIGEGMFSTWASAAALWKSGARLPMPRAGIVDGSEMRVAWQGCSVGFAATLDLQKNGAPVLTIPIGGVTGFAAPAYTPVIPFVLGDTLSWRMTALVGVIGHVQVSAPVRAAVGQPTRARLRMGWPWPEFLKKAVILPPPSIAAVESIDAAWNGASQNVPLNSGVLIPVAATLTDYFTDVTVNTIAGGGFVTQIRDVVGGVEVTGNGYAAGEVGQKHATAPHPPVPIGLTAGQILVVRGELDLAAVSGQVDGPLRATALIEL